MTEKELHRLKRPDLLALLVAQGRETAALQEKLKGTEEALQAAEELTARLKTRLDEKDAQLARLKTRLDEKDAQMERLKARLNDKDAQLTRLKARLDEKDDYIALLEKRVEDFDAGSFLKMENVQSLSEVSYCLHFVLRAAQKSVDDYLQKAQAPLPLELPATEGELPALAPAAPVPQGAGAEEPAGPAESFAAPSGPDEPAYSPRPFGFGLDLGLDFDLRAPSQPAFDPGPELPGAGAEGAAERFAALDPESVGPAERFAALDLEGGGPAERFTAFDLTPAPAAEPEPAAAPAPQGAEIEGPGSPAEAFTTFDPETGGPAEAFTALDPEGGSPAETFTAFDPETGGYPALDLGLALSRQLQRAKAGAFDPPGTGGAGPAPDGGAGRPGEDEAPPFRLGDFLDEGAAAVP